MKQWRQAYKQHQLSFDNIRKKPHFNLLSMMDIEKNAPRNFFLVFICGCFLEKLDVKFPDDEDFYHIIWGFNQ